MTTINTKRVPNRRAMRFTTPADALADVRVLAAAEREGRLTTLGNWTLGQAVDHLASWIDYAYTGVPEGLTPWYLRPLLRLVKKHVLTKGLPAGTGFRRTPGGTLATAVVPTEQAVEHYARAIERLIANPPTGPSDAFGPLTPGEWTMLQLRHAELHLSFFKAT